MAKVAIVTDSTVNLPQSYVDQYGITVLPQTVVWDHVAYLDGIDIHPTQFYERLAKSKTSPTTSQASPGQFANAYTSLLEKGHDILTVTISSLLSGTYSSATQAIAQFPGAQIELVDSLSASMGMGLMVLQAARAAEQGATLKECGELVRRMMPNTGVFFLVDTLEFLHRGGRIGSAARFLGTALDLKPILTLREGRIEPLERVRTQKRAFERMVEIVANSIGGRQPVRVANLHANAPELGKALLERVNQTINAIESIESEVSPVIGTHTGPGTVGLVYLTGNY